MNVLREKHSELICLFEEHATQTRALQEQARQETVPDVEMQQKMNIEELEWVDDYLRDLGSLFRMFRRQKFILSFTHEALRDAVLWRLSVLKPAVSYDMTQMTRSSSVTSERAKQVSGLSSLRCLPFHCLDNLGRPVAVLRVADLDLNTDMTDLKRDITLSLERLRVSLQRLNESVGEAPILQYVLVLDVDGVSMKTFPVDLVRWYIREIQPWYSGIIGAAFIINYSWAHSGLWTILKHLLPTSAIAKVLFPSREEMARLVSEDCLQSIYAVAQNNDQLCQDHDLSNSSNSSISPRCDNHSSPRLPPRESSDGVLTASTSKLNSANTKKTRSSRFSIDNPFFGYPTDTYPLYPRDTSLSTPPISNWHSEPTKLHKRHRLASHRVTQSQPNVPILRHGRRRKRDLVRALLVLYWRRWNTRLGLGMIAFLLFGLLSSGKMRWMRVAVMSALRGFDVRMRAFLGR